MKFSKKIIIVLLFVIGIAGLLVGSIAYYRIVVNGSITGSTGNAVFVLRDTEAGESWNNKVISLGKINPGDSGFQLQGQLQVIIVDHADLKKDSFREFIRENWWPDDKNLVPIDWYKSE